MKTIAYLSYMSAGEFKLKGLAKKAELLGAQIQHVEVDEKNPKKWLSDTKRLETTADAFIVNSSIPFEIDGVPQLLKERLEGGARAYLEVYRGNEAANVFVHGYGMHRDDITIFTDAQSVPNASPGLVSINVDTETAHHPELFTSVSQVVIGYPRLLRYWGNAMPALMAAGKLTLVDSERDVRVEMDGKRAPTCMGVWYGANGGAVLVSTGQLFHDPFFSVLGQPWPGIEANPRLAENVLRFLLKEYGTSLSERDYLARIEENLFDLVKILLANCRADWWPTLVPANIVEVCDKRREEEKSHTAAYAYLDFIHLKKIILHNWPVFEALFVDGEPVSKNAALKWMDRVNELRKPYAHPLRNRATGFAITAADSAMLKEKDAFCSSLLIKVKASDIH